MHHGFWVVHTEIKDKDNPKIVISKWSVWGLGIYNNWNEAEQAIAQAERQKLLETKGQQK